MVHGLRIKDGKATYVSRYVRTSRLKQEEYFGGAKFMKVQQQAIKFFISFSCVFIWVVQMLSLSLYHTHMPVLVNSIANGIRGKTFVIDKEGKVVKDCRFKKLKSR